MTVPKQRSIEFGAIGSTAVLALVFLLGGLSYEFFLQKKYDTREADEMLMRRGRHVEVYRRTGEEPFQVMIGGEYTRSVDVGW